MEGLPQGEIQMLLLEPPSSFRLVSSAGMNIEQKEITEKRNWMAGNDFHICRI